jgi:magnesium transporter
MIHAYVPRNGFVDRLVVAGDAPIPTAAWWVDLFEPTAEERSRVEAALGVQLPSREEMQEIEPSSRLYSEADAHYMTATVMSHTETPFPLAEPFTFVLTRRALVTLRYHDPRPIATYGARLMRSPGSASSGQECLIGLLEAFVDRIADILEKVALDLDKQARLIFATDPALAAGPAEKPDLRAVIQALGRDEDLATSARESLLSLNRVVRFLTQVLESAQAQEAMSKKDLRDQKARIKDLVRDMTSLAEHAAFELHKLNFLLDATLGSINIEQNQIIKLFSVAAVVFLPPTLVASIYGMNFRHMPELEWYFGYPVALILMVLSAVLPYLFFKRKGWF